VVCRGGGLNQYQSLAADAGERRCGGKRESVHPGAAEAWAVRRPGEGLITMGYALLVGNGINRVSGNGPSWESVIDSIATRLDQPQILKHLDVKPFTLAFDELILLVEKQGARRIDVERLVAEQIEQLRPGKYHKRVMTIRTQHILTTNYDYALELAIDPAHSSGGYDISGKYNLFRRRVAGDVNVWHIHGEAEVPRSIILGYDNYSGTVQRIRQYLKTGYHNLKSPFRREILDFDKDDTAYSWIDIFLRDDIHILGLTLDYIEIDLWWIIYYKATLENRKKKVGKTHYYRFSEGQPLPNEPAKLDSLKALGVEVHSIHVNDGYESAWERLLMKVEKQV
jgi:hypothetical protein